MSEILTKIKKKINFQKKLKTEIAHIETILTKDIHILDRDEIDELKKEKENLEKNLIKSKLSFDEKFKDFIYDFTEINEAKDIEWFIKDILPSQSIGVFYGNSGSGKSTFILFNCINLLEQDNDIYIFYIDADMSINKLKEIGIADILSKYKDRFFYAGKQNNADIVISTQELLKEVIELQKKYKNRRYLVIEDSLTILSHKRNGFINTDLLYKYEKQLRKAGATVVVIHHLNKSGVFADSQQIENYADYTYLVERNEFNNCILLKPQKASRFDIQPKAYKTENRKIIDEIDFKMANISYQESNFVKIIIDLLEHGEMNQSEIMKYLKQSSFFIKYGIGEKKVLTWLEKWAKEGKWTFEKRATEKNAKYFFIEQTEKHTKLQNNDKKEI